MQYLGSMIALIPDRNSWWYIVFVVAAGLLWYLISTLWRR